MKAFNLALIGVLLAAATAAGGAPGRERIDDAKLGMAMSYMGLGEYRVAADILAGLRDDYPEDEEIIFELARAYGYGGELEQSEELFGLLSRRRETILAHASILEANGRFEQASEKYIFLLERYPEDIEIKEKLADVSVWMGELERASDYYGRVFSEKPDDANLARRYADALFHGGEYARALEVYTAAGVELSSDRQRFENMGDAYMELGKYADAENIFSEIVEKYPEHADARVKLINARYALGKQEQAEKHIRIIFDGDVGDETELRLAEVFASYEEYDRAAGLLRGLVDRRPEDYRLLEFAADIYLGSGRHEEAEALYRKLLGAGYRTGEITIKLADVLRYQGKHDEAIEIYRQYIEE